MLVCIPTNGNAGAEDTVCDHFGSAPYFTLYDTSTDELKVIDNRNAHHSHGTCHPMNQLAKYHLDCIVCAGMGRRAIEALSTEGIKVYISECEKVEDIIEEIKAGNLTEIDPARACRGHGQQAVMGYGLNQPVQGRGAGFGQGGGRGSGRGSRGGRRRNRN
jgi:predicted Fe-Mo cluster-binding NifX family protein